MIILRGDIIKRFQFNNVITGEAGYGGTAGKMPAASGLFIRRKRHVSAKALGIKGNRMKKTIFH